MSSLRDYIFIITPCYWSPVSNGTKPGEDGEFKNSAATKPQVQFAHQSQLLHQPSKSQ